MPVIRKQCFLSTNRGGSWSAINTGLTDPSGNVVGVSALASAPSALYAGTTAGVFEYAAPVPTPTPCISNCGMPSPTPTPAATGSCVGDCDGSGQVTVDEIITLVNMVLGNQTQLSACPHGIPPSVTNVSQVDVAVIIQAVNDALNGCGG